ncbi:MAG: methyltransferase domain-containing protein, partial [Rhodoferax sp.]|nr:methyltransferase domain-containing protein [Rhodoferax sp.]
MPNADAQLHIYQRTVDGRIQDSLSIIAGLIDPGETVLDLGMGAGGLGQFLSQRQSVVTDGVSLNPAEAEIARKWYRQALLADLDRDDLTVLFAGQQYDCIVCADVLEHLKAPQNVLAQCKTLLKPGGRLLTSVPNAGYCGLVAELIKGDFRYRSEGLLDSTHLRFFTRTSLQRFFAENAWTTQSTMTTQRSLLESEFSVAFDSLPPAVARHLLALPDALTYQFISVSQPASTADDAEASSSYADYPANVVPAPVSALFSAQLYVAVQDHFDETSKLVVPGRIGDPRQSLAFEITPSAVPYSRVRFDPADRPGFFRLHHLQIRQPGGQLIWQWQAGKDSLSILGDAVQHEMLVSSPWETSAGAMLLLHGDDPWIELPLAPEQLIQISEHGARLEVLAGWPMSADYLQASVTINGMQVAHQHAVATLHQEIAHRELQRKEHELQHERLDRSVHELQARVATLGLTLREVRSEKQRLRVELHAAQRERNVFLAQFNQIALHLQGIEQSTVFRVTRPIVHLKLRFDRLLGRSAGRSAVRPDTVLTQPVPISKHAVDVIVPVFRGLEDTRLCLESVLASPCQTVWRLIVINDCSPEPEVTEWLRTFAQRDSRIELLENSENLGFVATVNRGMALSQ